MHALSLERSWLELIRQERVFAVIRSDRLSLARKMALAAAKGGIKLIEITANTDGAWQLVEELKELLPDSSIGVGTIVGSEDLDNAIAVGADYLFTPHTNVNIIDRAVAARIPIVPGALTPTEIITAWQAGATAVKVFPIQAVGGVSYLQALQGPMAGIPLIPTGGVTPENAPTFLQAGAMAVGLSGALFPAQTIAREDWGQITQTIAGFYQKLRTLESQNP
jgi:2-dehydro-3-deoxyphosphogluconate aldolase / (4S)-4-hydroxy-2-oxoglutarate aldolase